MSSVPADEKAHQELLEYFRRAPHPKMVLLGEPKASRAFMIKCMRNWAEQLLEERETEEQKREKKRE
jgi:hypothetical protein